MWFKQFFFSPQIKEFRLWSQDRKQRGLSLPLPANYAKLKTHWSQVFLSGVGGGYERRGAGRDPVPQLCTSQAIASCAPATGPSRPGPGQPMSHGLVYVSANARLSEARGCVFTQLRSAGPGRQRRTSESALTTRNPGGPGQEGGTQASPSQERPLCLEIHPAYKHTLSTRLHSGGRGKNNPRLQPRRNVHTDILSGRPPGTGRGAGVQ